MTTQPYPDFRRPDDASVLACDERAHRLLEQSGNGLIIACDETAECAPEERLRIAEIQWLDALLVTVHRPDSADQEARIQQVMRRIAESDERSFASPSAPALQSRKESMPSAPSGRRRPGATVAAAAAVFLGILVLRQALEEPATAMAALDRALTDASTATTREYELTSLVRRPAGDVQIVSTLYVRGGQRFALKHPLQPLPGFLWLGSDGQRIWMAPPVGPVLVSESQDVLGHFIVDQKLSTPYLQLTSVLSRLKDRYDLTRLGDERISDSSAPARTIVVQRLRATLRPDDSPWPQTVDLWLEPRLGTVRKMTLDWRSTSDALGPRFITFLLKSQPDVSPDFFEHDAHHDADRPVLGR